MRCGDRPDGESRQPVVGGGGVKGSILRKVHPMPLTTQPLTPNFGLEILDVDLRTSPNDLIAEIDALWVAHPVLLIRNQLLDEAQQIAFSKRLGKINIHVRKDIRSRNHPEVVMVSNLRLENGDNIGALASGEAKWHTDSCYKPKPDAGSLLYALEVPEDGGKTAGPICNLPTTHYPTRSKPSSRVSGCVRL